MITVTAIKDPFRPEENKKEFFDYSKEYSLSYYLQNINLYRKDVKFVIFVNGQEINIDKINDVYIEDDSKIAVSANIDATIATAVASWVAVNLSVAIGTTSFITSIYAGAYLATTFAIGYGLSQLASALAPDPPGLGDTRSDTTVEQTYGWGDLKQTSSEGVRIPYIFGTVKVSGHIINQFITINNNNETLNILLGICDHELDSIDDIRLNNQSYSNYRDIHIYKRLGTNSDSLIPLFNSIVAQQDVNSKLTKNNSVTVRTDGNQVKKIIIAITAPNGLYYSNDQGGLDARTADVKIEYKTVTAGSWTELTSQISNPDAPDLSSAGSGPFSNLVAYITSKFGIGAQQGTTEPQRFTFILNDLSADQYDIRVTRTNDEETSYRGSSDIYLSFIQEIIPQELIYPGLAKYGISILATEQLSGSVPPITCLATRNYVNVYNEDTGYWVQKRATSPAWVVYALLNEFADIPVSKIIWDDFSDWADYCDELIDGEYRFSINVAFYDGNFWGEIQKIAKMGRAAILRRGTRYGVFVDKEETTVSDMFSLGNIIDGSFSIQYLPKKDRASGIEIEYTDIDRDYERQVITIYSDDYLSGDNIPQKANISIQAAISQEEAVREGVYRINSNQLLNRVITFDAFIDSFACTVGDLFYFQHIIPDYSIGISGRIIAAGNDDGSGNPYVQIDRDVVIGAGETYAIQVRLRDNTIVEKIVTNSPETTDTLTLSSSWSTVPTIVLGQEQPVYIFGIANTYKKTYRLTGVTRRDDFIRTLTGIEYIPEIYTNNDGFIIEEQVENIIIEKAINVEAIEILRFDEYGNYRIGLNINWGSEGRKGSSWDIWLQDLTANTDPVKVGNTQLNTFNIPLQFLVKGNQYQIYINIVDEGAVNKFSNVKVITLNGKDIFPDDIVAFYLQNNQLVWEYPGNKKEIQGFKLKSGKGSNVSWTYADFLNNGEFVTSPYTIERTGDTITYLLKAYDYNGLESENPAKIITNLGDLIVSNVVEETTLSPPFDGDITNGTVIGDVLYSDNNGDFWSGVSTNNIWKAVPGEIFFDSQYLEMSYIGRFIPVYLNVPVIVEVDAVAPTGLLVYYRESQTAAFWSGNTGEMFWAGTSSESFWTNTGADFRLLPTPVNLTSQQYEIKLVTNSGVGQSQINSIKINYDFPDIVETFEDLAISSSGTRVPITKDYKVIKNVGLTLQDDGSTATTLEINDKDTLLGPLIYAYDKDKVKTTANIDVRVQGY